MESDPDVADAIRHSGDSFRDARIRAVFAIAPVFGSGFDRVGLSDVKVPVAIVVGLGDTTAPPDTNAKRYAAFIKNSKLELLPRSVGHYTFVPECTDQGKKMLGRICHDEPGVTRAAVHAQVSALALNFFERSLTSRRH